MESKKYTCNICNKLYKSYKSMWFHKYKYHDNILNKSSLDRHDIPGISPEIEHNIPGISPEIEHNIPEISPEISLKNDNIKIKKIDQRICNYCNKEFSSYKNLHRHLQICKAKENIIKEKEELIKLNQEKDKKIEELKKIMLDMMNKKYKMHPKTFQKMINSNNSNSNNNNNNNITINNNIKYIEIGREDLPNVFTKDEKLMILTQFGSPIENIMRYVHLNDKYPQLEPTVLIL
jgi:hypothetical protein